MISQSRLPTSFITSVTDLRKIFFKMANSTTSTANPLVKVSFNKRQAWYLGKVIATFLHYCLIFDHKNEVECKGYLDLFYKINNAARESAEYDLAKVLADLDDPDALDDEIAAQLVTGVSCGVFPFDDPNVKVKLTLSELEFIQKISGEAISAERELIEKGCLPLSEDEILFQLEFFSSLQRLLSNVISRADGQDGITKALDKAWEKVTENYEEPNW